MIPTAAGGLLLTAVVLAFGACGDDRDSGNAAAEPSGQSVSATTTVADDTPPCGVTLAEVQALLPGDSGVTENSTPDPGRCNFTWDDGGARGIDVAIVPGGRPSFQVPPSYEPLDGYGDEAHIAASGRSVSAVAFVRDDLYAADVVADGTGATRDELRALCLRLLELALS